MFAEHVSSFQKSRAVIATLFNMALLANPSYDNSTLEQLADQAIEGADMLLGKLGVPDEGNVVDPR